MGQLEKTKPIRTPWGLADSLPARQLSPGPGTPRDLVERNQRARLYGAMVAVIDEVGYDKARVGDVAKRAGVSRRALYEYFADREECFLATFDILMESMMAALSRAYSTNDPWDTRLRAVLDELIEILVEQPAAARLGFLEVYACGPAAMAHSAKASDELGRMATEAIKHSPERAGMPPAVTTALVGGLRTIIENRLRRKTQDELPHQVEDLWSWVLGYHTPPTPLRSLPVTAPTGPRFVATLHVERLFVALAHAVDEKGYQAVTVNDITQRASVSLSTFYKNFRNKEEAFLAACDAGVAQAFQATHTAYLSETDWPLQVRAAMGELLAYLSAEPEWTRLAMVEVLAAGPRAQARCDRTIEMFTGLLEPGLQRSPKTTPVALEAIGGAVYSLMYDQIRNHGAERLPEVLPTATFILLAPFIGTDRATEIANGGAEALSARA